MNVSSAGRSELARFAQVSPTSLDHPVHGNQQLRAQLADAVTGPGATIDVVCGPGGTGKTTLAVEATTVARSAGLDVWWVHAGDSQLLEAGMRNLAHLLSGTPERVEQAFAAGGGIDLVWRLLDHHRSDRTPADSVGSAAGWFLIFDNADDPTVLTSTPASSPDLGCSSARSGGWLRTPMPGGRVLITTRVSDPTRWPHAARIQRVAGLTSAEAVEVLCDRAGPASLAGPGGSALRGDPRLTELLDRLHRLPLALDLAGRQLRPVVHDWDHPAGTDDRVGDLLAALGTGRAGDVITAIYAPLIRRVLDQFGPERDDAELLLWHIAAHAEAPLPYLLMLHPDRLASTDLPFTGPLTPSRVERILDRLSDGGLINHTGTRTCTLHPLIRETLRAGTTRPARFRHAAATTLATITDPHHQPHPTLPTDQPRYWPAWQLLLPHLIYLAEHPDPANPAALTHTLAAATRWALAAGDHATAATLQDTARPLTRHLAPDHPAQLALRLQHARLASHRGIHPQHERHRYEELLADQVRVLGADHPDTLATRHNLAGVIADAGDLVEARRRDEELLADRVRVLGADHPDTLTTRYNLAWVAGQAGDLVEARRRYEELLADRVRVLGEDHPDTLDTRHNLAGVAGQAGDLVEARHRYEQLLVDRVRVLGEDHPDTLDTRHNLAGVAGAAGDLVEARHRYEQLLADRVRVLGEDHPHTLDTRYNLAWVAGAAGDLVEARHRYEQLLADRVRVLGEDHPHTLDTRYNLAWVAGAAGDLVEARHRYEQLLADRVRVLGEDHPDTLDTRYNLAGVIAGAGDLVEARRRYEELLADRVRVLGADHPDTLTTRYNLAWVAGQAGDLVEARRRYEELLADRVRVLGADHPHTLTTRNNLAMLDDPEDGSSGVPAAG